MEDNEKKQIKKQTFVRNERLKTRTHSKTGEDMEEMVDLRLDFEQNMSVLELIDHRVKLMRQKRQKKIA